MFLIYHYLDKMFNKLIQNRQFLEIDPGEIDTGDETSFFSFPPDLDALISSIKKLGLVNPVYLAKKNGTKKYYPVCGHRRLGASKNIGLEKIPAFILSPGPESPSVALAFNARENLLHRSYNCVETSNIFFKLKGFGVEEAKIVADTMPILGLEKSRKIYEDYLSLQMLSDELKVYLVEINAPVKIGARLAKWKSGDQGLFVPLINSFKPGGNKLREIIELLEEIGLRGGVAPGESLKEEGLVAIYQSRGLAPSDKARGVLTWLREKRNPMLSDKRRDMEARLRELQDIKGAELRSPENIEGEDLILSLRFSTGEELISRLEKIKSGWPGEKLEEIFKLLRE